MPHVEKMIRQFINLCLAVLLISASGAHAKSLDELVQLRILSGWQNENGTQVAAIQITLPEGWKTYWRAPGDAGIPPRFDWSGSSNLLGVEVNWPTPKLILTSGVQTIGYDRGVTFPLTLTPAKAGQAITLAGKLELGICKEICVPVTAKFSQALAKGQTKRDSRIVAALAERPYSAAEAGVTRVVCRVSPIKDGLHLVAEVDLPATGARETAIIETDNPGIWVSQAQTTRRGGSLTAEADLFHMSGSSFVLNRSGVRITVLGQSMAVDIQGCPAG